MQKTIDGIRLAYDDAGQGDVLVLLHGFPFDRTIWDETFERLAQRARVIRIDLRGSGESAPGSGPALMETLAGDVFGLLEALAVERAIIAGHSMGGYVALAFFRMYAERVAGLALIASQFGPDTPARSGRRREEAANVLAHGPAVLVEPVVADVFDAAFAAANPAAVARVRAIVASQNRAGAGAQIIGMQERVDSADLIEDITVPSLLVGGQNDRLIAPELLAGSAAALVDCELLLLPHAAHLPMLEAAAATIAALERLIARCAVTSRADRQSARANPA